LEFLFGADEEDEQVRLNKLYYAIEDTVADANIVEERIWVVGSQDTRMLDTMKQLCVNHNRLMNKLHTLVVAFGEQPGVTNYNDWVKNEKPAEYTRYVDPPYSQYTRSAVYNDRTENQYQEDSKADPKKYSPLKRIVEM
jgi:hypothetical protein